MHVGKSSKKDAAGASVALWIRERVVRDACHSVVHRFPKLTSEAFTLTVIPVLDHDQVELGGSTEEDRERQRGR